MAELKLDDEQLTQAMNVAIINAIGETGREAIVKEAAAYLTKTTSNGYGQRNSALIDIIHRSAEKIATDLMTEKLSKDEVFLAEVTRLYEDAVKAVLRVEDREKLVQKLAGKLADGFAGYR